MLRDLIILLACVAASRPFLMDEDLCVGGDEFLAHPNCSLFYQCSNGVPYLQSCPEGYFFNPSLEICDYPFNVPECQGGTRPPNPSTTTTGLPTNATTPTTTTNATSPTTPTPTTSTTPGPITETPCNLVLTETSGHIAYKVNSTADNSERCAWTISVPGASKFKFILQQAEFQQFYDGITVLGISRDGDDVGISSIKLEDVGLVYELEQSIAILMFYTSVQVPSSGFLLSYVVETNAPPLFSVNEIGFTNASLDYQFVRGQDDELYENNEFTTLLHVAEPGSRNLTSQGLIYFADECDKDYVLVFKFFHSGSFITWEESDRICGSNPGYFDVTHTDVTLYIFKSNEVNVDEGLSFYLTSRI